LIFEVGGGRSFPEIEGKKEAHSTTHPVRGLHVQEFVVISVATQDFSASNLGTDLLA
jgi:hypothetical protein